jgi:predicted CopG family antitoxin
VASKTISIRDNVYKLLIDARRENESFSDVIERLLKKDKTDLSEYFGSLKDNPLLDALEEDSRKIRAMEIVGPCNPIECREMSKNGTAKQR